MMKTSTTHLPDWPEPRRFQIDPVAGRLVGTEGRYEKRLKELAGLYADEAAFVALCAQRGDEVVYEVTEHRPSASPGDLITGVTRMAPGHVGSEFFMTRGHQHAVADRPELYVGLAGRGLMSMESPDGQTRLVEMAPMTACYVPPWWIHRSCNLGDADFTMLFCYPADAGQDYAIIQRSGGMRLRIVVDGGPSGWRAEENPHFVARAFEDGAWRARAPEGAR